MHRHKYWKWRLRFLEGGSLDLPNNKIKIKASVIINSKLNTLPLHYGPLFDETAPWKIHQNNNPFSDLVDFLTSHSHRMERATVLRTNIVFFLGLQLKWNSTKNFSRSCNQLEWGYDLSGYDCMFERLFSIWDSPSSRSNNLCQTSLWAARYKRCALTLRPWRGSKPAGGLALILSCGSRGLKPNLEWAKKGS